MFLLLLAPEVLTPFSIVAVDLIIIRTLGSSRQAGGILSRKLEKPVGDAPKLRDITFAWPAVCYK